MFCEQCGTLINDTAKFCVKCGAKVAAQPVQPVQPVQPIIYPQQPVYPYYQQTTYPQPVYPPAAPRTDTAERFLGSVGNIMGRIIAAALIMVVSFFSLWRTVKMSGEIKEMMNVRGLASFSMVEYIGGMGDAQREFEKQGGDYTNSGAWNIMLNGNTAAFFLTVLMGAAVCLSLVGLIMSVLPNKGKRGILCLKAGGWFSIIGYLWILFWTFSMNAQINSENTGKFVSFFEISPVWIVMFSLTVVGIVVLFVVSYYYDIEYSAVCGEDDGSDDAEE